MRPQQRPEGAGYRAINVRRVTLAGAFAAGSGPVGRRHAERRGRASRGRTAIDQDAVARDGEMRQVRGAVAVGEYVRVVALRGELAQTARLFLAATVGSSERAVEAIAVPRNTRRDHVIETELPPEFGHVEVDARGHEHEVVARLAMAADGGER